MNNHGIAYWSYSSKKSYGNKTFQVLTYTFRMSYSSKKSYGNKTAPSGRIAVTTSYSSKKIIW